MASDASDLFKHGPNHQTTATAASTSTCRFGSAPRFGEEAPLHDAKRVARLAENQRGAGNYAARLCADLDRDGFNDWYLPSKDELNLMYENRDAIGNLNEAGYWSSSEVGTTVWIQNLGTGDVSQTESTTNNAVRAIRAF